TKGSPTFAVFLAIGPEASPAISWKRVEQPSLPLQDTRVTANVRSAPAARAGDTARRLASGGQCRRGTGRSSGQAEADPLGPGHPPPSAPRPRRGHGWL